MILSFEFIYLFPYAGGKLSSLIKLKRIGIDSLGETAVLEWFSCEGSTSHRAPHISDSFILLLAIQGLVALAGGVQTQVYAQEQGQYVFSSRSPTVSSAQRNHSGSNHTDSNTYR